MHIGVVAPENRAHLSFVDAASLAAMESFESMYITRAEYDAEGASIVHRKCF